MGLGFGIGLGVVVAGAFEMMDDRLHTESEIKKLLPAEIIAEIPAIVTEADAQEDRKRQWLGWATAAVVFTFILAGSAFSYLRG